MTAKFDLALNFSFGEVGSNTFNPGPYWSGAISHALSLVSGVGAGQFDLAYLAERTILTGANDDVDVSGVLTTPLGVSFTAAELAGVIIINRQKDGTANTTTLTPGGAGTPVAGFAAALRPISPGGIFMMLSPDAAGIATVSGGSTDLLRITNSAGATNKYILGLIGRTA